MKRILSLGLVLILALSSCSVHKTEPQGSQEASLPTQTVTPSESSSKEYTLPEIRSLNDDFKNIYCLYGNSGYSIITKVEKEKRDLIYLSGNPDEKLYPGYTTFYYPSHEYPIIGAENSPFGETVTFSLLGKEIELKYKYAEPKTTNIGQTLYGYHDPEGKGVYFTEDGVLWRYTVTTLATIERPETADQAIAETYPLVQQLTNNFGYQYVSVFQDDNADNDENKAKYTLRYYNMTEEYIITSQAYILVLADGRVTSFSREGIIHKESEIQIDSSRQNRLIAAKIQEYYNACNDGIERELIASYLRGSPQVVWFKGELYVEYQLGAIHLKSYGEGGTDDVGYEYPPNIIIPLRLLVDEKK